MKLHKKAHERLENMAKYIEERIYNAARQMLISLLSGDYNGYKRYALDFMLFDMKAYTIYSLLTHLDVEGVDDIVNAMMHLSKKTWEKVIKEIDFNRQVIENRSDLWVIFISGDLLDPVEFVCMSSEALPRKRKGKDKV